VHDARRLLILAWRGWTKRCPNCGSGGLFTRWVTISPACPTCGFTFEREEGYWVGAMGANIIVTELVFVAAMIVTFVLTWPDSPIREMIIGGVILTVTFPIFFYPFSKTLWMAFDLAFHPPDDAQPAREQ
jgi:uncharacterized protein (DUF983 family)